ncbi:MAG: hypothetical protein F6K19_17955 [Cyanothece sp. SIO1E1]|nr:hypothetical protein [Cyanothece sp. SIO1E1]
MPDSYVLKDAATDNEQSLQRLAEILTRHLGQFSLILVRCNYSRLRGQILQRLRETSPLSIQELVLPTSIETLYTTIQTNLREPHPQALMVIGLESVYAIDQVLKSTDQVREEFRQHFPFPLVLWITDQVLHKLVRFGPAFRSWATISIKFTLPPEDLIASIQQHSHQIFANILETHPDPLQKTSALGLELNPQLRTELAAALKDIRNSGHILEPELKASLDFALGLDAYNHQQMGTARQYYEQSLAFWQSQEQGPAPVEQRGEIQLERQACLHFYLGLWWRKYALIPQVEQKQALLEARKHLQQCIDIWQQLNRPHLVAKFINTLGEILQKLNDWEALETIAQTAINLNQTYRDPVRLAHGYGFLAAIAQAKSDSEAAQQHTKAVIQVITEVQQSTFTTGTHTSQPSSDLAWAKQHHWDLYLLLLAQKQHLTQVEITIKYLEAARAANHHEYDPELYLWALRALQTLYFNQKRYLQAFELKQERFAIEQQYGLRAFIGAGQLQPPRQISRRGSLISPSMTAFGRQQDVERLINERITPLQSNLTVLYGPARVGKSSLVTAGLVPTLPQRQIEGRSILPVVLNHYSHWVDGLGQCLTQTLQQQCYQLSVNRYQPIEPLWADRCAPSTILEQLKKNIDQNLLTVLFFDQFEEFFFTYKNPIERRSFFEFLQACLNLRFVKVILLLREEYLHHLLEAKRFVSLDAIDNDILSRDILYYLGNFSPGQAKSVLQTLTKHAQLDLEPALANALIQDLVGTVGEIHPAELQISGMQLQTEELTTLEAYQARGSMEQLVERYLETVIADCGPEHQPMAWKVLALLTDEDGSCPARTEDELKAALQLPTPTLQMILTILVGSGLVSRLQRDPKNQYQLVHAAMVGSIRQEYSLDLETRLEQAEAGEKATDAMRDRIEEANRTLTAARKEAAHKIERANQRLMDAQRKEAEIKQFQLQAEIKLQAAQTQLAAIESTWEAAVVGTELELAGAKALRQLESSQLEALLAAMRTGQNLKTQLQTGNACQKYPAFGPVLTLQRILSEIQEKNRFQGYRNRVLDVSFSPDGQTLASASADGTATLWNQQGKPLASLQAHQGWIWSICFSPDGQTLATASGDSTIRLWQVQGEPLGIIHGHKRGVYSARFSPNGQTLATASADGTARLWNLAGEPLAIFQQHQGSVRSICFSPDGFTLATASGDNTARLWDLHGRPIEVFQGHRGSVREASFNPNGQFLATASGDKTARLWDLQGQQLMEFQGHQAGVRSLSFSPNGKTLATASEDGITCLWDLEGILITTFPGNQSWINSVRFSPDGQTLATASGDGTIRLWDLQSGKLAPNQPALAHPLETGLIDRTADSQQVANRLDELLARGCDWLKDYLNENPQVSESDRHLYQAICDQLG